MLSTSSRVGLVACHPRGPPSAHRVVLAVALHDDLRGTVARNEILAGTPGACLESLAMPTREIHR
eukprot:36363-Lingulodinium_polyedra.AAC.1